MKKHIDLIRIPEGYSEDIREFCQPILEVAMLRGEQAGEFDDDFFFELLDADLSRREQEIILYNARRYLEDKRYMNDREFQPFYEEEFETGCREFIRGFLLLNQLHTVRGLKSEVWKITLHPVTSALWQLTVIVQ